MSATGINKLLLCLSVILLFTLLVGAYAVDLTYDDHLVQANDDDGTVELARYMAKRRFLPTRRDLHGFDSDEDDAHLHAKRYFLKSKRYFLNSKRDSE